MIIHRIKTHPKHFDAQIRGEKQFEIRVNDRNYAVGDLVIQREWDPETKLYSGREISGRISYISYGGQFGLPAEICVFSLKGRMIGFTFDPNKPEEKNNDTEADRKEG